MNRTKFIGKEKDKESNYADHGVRKYYDEIGRFTSIDPLWEKYYSLTPYQYAGNNPVSFLDGNGLNWFRNQSTGEIKWYDQTGDFSSAQTYETWEDLGVNLIYFDGSSLTMYKEDKTSKSFPAVSGELEEGKTKPENQLEQGGPIPEGSHYKVDPKDIQKWSSLSTWQQIISIIRRGEWPGGVMSWGHYRVPIQPKNEKRGNRTGNYFIHGGWFPGSGGCIDLWKYNSLFFKEFRIYNKILPLVVKYKK